jgi:calcineurin-like phosphoesterase family protein
MKQLKIKQTPKQRVYFTSDLHGHHTNICYGVSTWKDKETKCRKFDTVEEMNSTIINNINAKVQQNDILICLGDWTFGDKDNIRTFRNRIICENVHLILGNHDKYISDPSYGYQECFNSVQDSLDVIIDGERFCCYHYKQMVWNKSHKGSYHLYGHSHGSSEQFEIGKSMDVGIDNYHRLFSSYEPFSVDEIIKHLKNRKSYEIDHHTE